MGDFEAAMNVLRSHFDSAECRGSCKGAVGAGAAPPSPFPQQSGSMSQSEANAILSQHFSANPSRQAQAPASSNVSPPSDGVGMSAAEAERILNKHFR